MSFFDKLGAAFNDPKYAGLMGMGEGLMAAGGAHRLPVNMGQALAMGMQQGNQQSQDAQAAHQKQLIELAKYKKLHDENVARANLGQHFAQLAQSGQLPHGVDANALAGVARAGNSFNLSQFGSYAGDSQDQQRRDMAVQSAAQGHPGMSNVLMEAGGRNPLTYSKVQDGVSLNPNLAPGQQPFHPTAVGQSDINRNQASAVNQYASARKANVTSQPTSVREFEYAKKHGFHGSFMDFSSASTKPSETQRYISQLVSRGIPRGMAQDVAHGKINVQQDQFGNAHYYDSATGHEVTPQDYQQGQSSNAVPRPTPPQNSNNSHTYALPQRKPVTATQINQNQSAPNNSGQPTGIFAAIHGGSGPVAYGQSLANNTVGAFTDSLPYPGVPGKKESIGLFNQTVRHMLMPSGRPSNYTQKQINSLLPDPNAMMVNPRGEVERLHKLHDILTQRIQANEQELNGAHITSKHRGELSDENSKLHTILGLMGKPATPISQMSKQQLDSLDPSHMSHDELQQAARREDELNGQ